MRDLLTDLRYALRTFAKQPAFTATAVLSLAIGIGANTAIFSVADALLLRPLPYTNADRLAILWNRSPGLNIAEDWFSTAQYFDIKTAGTSFEQLAIALGNTMNLTGGTGEPERVGVIRVSSNLLPMLGARTAKGNLFEAGDDSAGRAPKAVLSYATWMRRYGGEPDIVGKSVQLNGQAIQISGVLARDFSLPHEVLPTLGVADDGEIFLPLPMNAGAATFRGREDYNIIGRLKRGVATARAQAEMDALTARLRRAFPATYPPNGGLTFSIVPLTMQVVGNARTPLFILLGAVGFVLLIACANVANLLLARALARRREMTVRAALGASRARITQQLLTEGLVLALAGGALGVAFAYIGIAWIHALHPPNVPRLGAIGVTTDVLAFTLALSVISALLFGLAPAAGLGRLDLHTSLQHAGRGAVGASTMWGRGGRLRRVLVVSELALSVILLAGAGLLIRSVAHLRDVPPGYETSHVLTFELSLSGAKYPNAPALQTAYEQLWQRLDQVAGVEQAGAISSLPLSDYMSWGPITIEGYAPPGGEDFINADQRITAGRYFEAMRIPLKGGRYFNEGDRANSPGVVIVDALLAQQYWPSQDAVGKRLRTGPISSRATNWLTVVGVVGRVKQYGLDSDGRIAVYFPVTQFPVRSTYVTLRTARSPETMTTAIRGALREFDPDIPMYRVRTMDERVEISLARRRFAMTLLAVFAGLALALAAVGVYGVLAYLVTQSTRDIGIRLALGATRGHVLAMVMRLGALVTATGLAIGLAGAWALTRFLQTLLFGVSRTDFATFAAASLALAIVAIVATFVPARRAARIDPMVALRAE